MAEIIEARMYREADLRELFRSYKCVCGWGVGGKCGNELKSSRPACTARRT